MLKKSQVFFLYRIESFLKKCRHLDTKLTNLVLMGFLLFVYKDLFNKFKHMFVCP